MKKFCVVLLLVANLLLLFCVSCADDQFECRQAVQKRFEGYSVYTVGDSQFIAVSPSGDIFYVEAAHFNSDGTTRVSKEVFVTKVEPKPYYLESPQERK